MPKFEVHRPKRRSRGRLWVTIIFIAVLISPILALIATMEATPAVSQRAPANADDVARAKLLYRRLAAFKITKSREEPIEVTVGDLNSLSALATRAFPAVRGEAAVESGALKLTVAVKIPAIPLERWLNFRSVVQPSGSGLNLSSIRLGQWALPPTLVLTAVDLRSTSFWVTGSGQSCRWNWCRGDRSGASGSLALFGGERSKNGRATSQGSDVEARVGQQ